MKTKRKSPFLELHDIVKHPDHRGVGEVWEITRRHGRNMPAHAAFVIFPRESWVPIWVAPERCRIVGGKAPSQRRSCRMYRRVQKAIAKAAAE
jgi:hypothetical protein